MTISHVSPSAFPGPFVYAAVGGFACSICAPAGMGQDEVEAFAQLTVDRTRGDRWRAVDKSLPPISIPGKTPNPCNDDPNRLHWFLVSGLFP